MVFVCMEPSLGGWARSVEEGRARVEGGFRNFVSSLEDFILHFCIRQYLCEPTDGYHITDVSKGAMLVKQANIDRTQRYDRWHALLREEVDLMAVPEAGIFAVGKDVAKHLAARAFPRPFTEVLHYSGQNTAAWGRGIVGHEASFEKFKTTVSIEAVIEAAEKVLEASVPPPFRAQTLARLRASQLSESRKQLMFNYKLAFESYRSLTAKSA